LLGGVELFDVSHKSIVGFPYLLDHPDLDVLVFLGEGLRDDFFQLVVLGTEVVDEVEALQGFIVLK